MVFQWDVTAIHFNIRYAKVYQVNMVVKALNR